MPNMNPNRISNESSCSTASSHDKRCVGHTKSKTELSSMYFVFAYLDLTLMVISVIVLVAGLITIHHCKKKHNQNIILAGLTLSELFGAVGGALEILFERNSSVSVIQPTLQSLRSIASFGIVFTLYILTIDRFNMVAAPHRYHRIMTRKRTFWLVAIAIISAVALGLVKYLVRSEELAHILTNSLLMIGISYLIFAISTYSFIAVKLHRSKKYTSSHMKSSRSHLKFQKQFLMPSIIIATFILFHAIPCGVLVYVYKYREGENAVKRSQDVGYGICSLLPSIGYTTDVVTYIFLTPRYKRSVSGFRWRRVEKKGIDQKQMRMSAAVIMAVATSHFQTTKNDLRIFFLYEVGTNKDFANQGNKCTESVQ